MRSFQKEAMVPPKLLQRNFLVSMLIVLLLPALLLAAGGGGGGGGGSGGGSGGGGGGGSSGPYLAISECNDKGQVIFSQRPPIQPVILGREDGINLTIPGEWNGNAFTSEEAAILQTGRYTLYDEKNGNEAFDCPGLVFSCKVVSLEIKSCTFADGNITATFSLQNAPAEDLKYQFTAPGTAFPLRYTKNSYSPELRSLRVQRQGNEQVLTVNGAPPVNSLEISHPQCVGQYYVYSQFPCSSAVQAETVQNAGPGANGSGSDRGGQGGDRAESGEFSGKELKCGGYLDLHDRVLCRLSLREEQREEYENFFPEECRGWSEQQQCVQLYRQVQDCWELASGRDRISCLKRKVGVVNVRLQREECRSNRRNSGAGDMVGGGTNGGVSVGTDSGANEAANESHCLEQLRKDTHTLIKLRLYNLEEEAEGWMEEGLLTREEVASFVVKMEVNKLAFNRAESTAQRREVILQAREQWLELVREVAAKENLAAEVAG